VPKRSVKAPALQPETRGVSGLFNGTGAEASTRIRLSVCDCVIRNTPMTELVPIVPDEARTFGIDPLFSEVGIIRPRDSYMSGGQQRPDLL